MTRVLAINPGSTSTKVAFFEDGQPLLVRDVRHSRQELSGYARVWDQLPKRLEAVDRELGQAGLSETQPHAVIGRGGLLAPMPGGTYAVNDAMLAELEQAARGEHPCNLGAPMARAHARRWKVPAYITDPVVTDELDEAARLTGLPQISRRSLFHALNQRAAARQACERLGQDYADARLVVVHMGGGISIGAHRRGRVVDVVNALDGEGPFSAERTGTLPLLPLLDMLEQGRTDIPTLRATIQRGGGIYAHLGTNDLRAVEERMEQGDDTARRVFEAYVWNVAKHAWSMAAPLLADAFGQHVDGVVLTGGMAHSQRLTELLEERLSALAPVVVIPGEEEMNALDAAARRVLCGTEEAREYCAE